MAPGWQAMEIAHAGLELGRTGVEQPFWRGQFGKSNVGNGSEADYCFAAGAVQGFDVPV